MLFFFHFSLFICYYFEDIQVKKKSEIKTISTSWEVSMLCLYTLYAYESLAKSWDREGGGVKVQLIYDGRDNWTARSSVICNRN